MDLFEFPTVSLSRGIADSVEEFKSRKLPLHGLINNIGVENPNDAKSKEGFDVRIAAVMVASCYSIAELPAYFLLVSVQSTHAYSLFNSLTWHCCAAYTSVQLHRALLFDSPSTREAHGDAAIKGCQPHLTGGTQWGHRVDRHRVSLQLHCTCLSLKASQQSLHDHGRY